MNKPELLLPVGNIESFYAAIKGGADAIYVGLKSFNARGRAANFNNIQFQLLLDEALRNNVKVYATLNTVIKNREIPELLDTLWFLSKTKVAAVIIQDWGTYYLLKKHFPKLVVHASTQMANHNSTGTNFSQKLGFERVILARELTMPELNQIQKNSTIETEVFVHGALCYSFSGMCNFSSYLGGAGANRGLCTQPCRRFYNINKEKHLAFSLKDNQLIEQVTEMAKIGVASLKVEGRLKSGEYVYQVAQAYRKVIDGTGSLSEAQNMLKLDMGREKTQWFYAKDVKHAISETPNTGLYVGKVTKVENDGFIISTQEKLETGNRLRIKTSSNSEQVSFKINDIEELNDGLLKLSGTVQGLKAGNEVFLAGLRQLKFPNKLKGNAKQISNTMPIKLKKQINGSIRKFKPDTKSNLFVRIDSVDWLRKIRLEELDYLIINLKKSEWPNLRIDVPFIQKNKQKIWFELPQFISEKDLKFYKDLCGNFVKRGFKQFSLSHLAQKELLPKEAVFGTNENVYCYNDAASQALKNEGAKWVTSPFENEYDNLLSGANRNIVVPVHFYPKLFYSRQPVQTGEGTFFDDTNKEFKKEVLNGITIVVPTAPVSLLQYKNKLSGKGFNQYLIDLSFEKPSKHTFKRLLQKLKKSEQDQPSTTFNFKKGLK